MSKAGSARSGRGGFLRRVCCRACANRRFAGVDVRLLGLRVVAAHIVQERLVGRQDAFAQGVARRLADEVDIDTVRLITPDEGLAELRLHLEALGENPLPATVRAVARPDVPVLRLELLAGRLKSEAGVDAVVVEKTWLERLTAIRTLVRRAAGMVAALLGVAAVLISSATVRLAVLVRLTELQVHALVGASARFMRRLFLYLGVIYGFGGGMVAAMLLTAALASLEAPLRRLFASYGAETLVVGFDGAFVLALLGVGVGLGPQRRQIPFSKVQEFDIRQPLGVRAAFTAPMIAFITAGVLSHTFTVRA